jgi:hypothetical protein
LAVSAEAGLVVAWAAALRVSGWVFMVDLQTMV